MNTTIASEPIIPSVGQLSQLKQELYSDYALGKKSLHEVSMAIAAIRPPDTRSRRMRMAVAIVSAFAVLFMPSWYTQSKK